MTEMARRNPCDIGVPIAKYPSTLEPEIDYQRNLCRVMKNTEYRGYRKDILTEKMTNKDKHNITLLTCKACNGEKLALLVMENRFVPVAICESLSIILNVETHQICMDTKVHSILPDRFQT